MHRIAAAVVLVLLCGVARAERYRDLGRLERQAVDEALAARGLVLDDEPAGKTIGRIHVVTRPVFSKRDSFPFLTWFNIFHRTTREDVVEREVLLRPGMVWSQALVDETLRNLRDVFIHNVVVILAVRGEAEGTVDVLVVTRDVWSLRLNSNFEIADRKVTLLSFSLSENNFLGWRKKLVLSFRMDQGAIAVGPTYTDPNIAGTRLTAVASWRSIFGRVSGQLEGSSSALSLAYPLWSLKSKWGAGMEVAHFDGIDRFFQGTSLRPFDAPETAAIERIPYQYRRRALATEAALVRSFGTRVIQRVSLGHELDLQRPSLLESFPTGLGVGEFPAEDAVLRDSFETHVFPRSERSSALFTRWRLFTPDYMTTRDLDTFDLREDYQLGPSLEAKVSAARTELGSEADFVRASAGAQWTWQLGVGGLARAAAGWGARLQGGEWIDQLASGRAYAASPTWHCTARVMAVASMDVLMNETANRFLTAGGDNGLRGFSIAKFIGQARVITHLELRTVPRRLWFLRYGGVLFWDMGHAADAVSELSMQHDVGFGVRYLIPQIDPFVFRADWAFALTSDEAGWPGRLTLGIFQVF